MLTNSKIESRHHHFIRLYWYFITCLSKYFLLFFGKMKAPSCVSSCNIFGSQAKHPAFVLRLQAYIQTYLEQEVQQEGLTRNIGAFSRFLEIASFSQGESLNITDVAREAHINRKVYQW